MLDFQTVVPALLFAVRVCNSTARKSALECLALLLHLAEKKFTEVYSLDTIYGKSSGECARGLSLFVC